jgi:hypothetical protein
MQNRNAQAIGEGLAGPLCNQHGHLDDSASLPCWLRPRQRFILTGTLSPSERFRADPVMPCAIPVLRLATKRRAGLPGRRFRTPTVLPGPASKQVASLSGTWCALGRSCLAALLAAPKAAVLSDLMPRSPFRDMEPIESRRKLPNFSGA